MILSVGVHQQEFIQVCEYYQQITERFVLNKPTDYAKISDCICKRSLESGGEGYNNLTAYYLQLQKCITPFIGAAIEHSDRAIYTQNFLK